MLSRKGGVFFLCLFLGLAVYAAAQEPAPRYALVIGNGAYQHLDNLSNTVNDASDIAAKLSALGYRVELQINCDFAAMTQAAGAWIRRLSADSSSEGFFWYAGHGVQVSGENYLLPVDIDAEDEAAIVYSSYPLGRLLLSLEQTAKNKLNVVVLDACRDNPFKNLSGSGRGLSRGFVTVEYPPQDIFVMFSTAPGTVAADGEGGRNSPFTEAFLKYMDSGEILPVMAGLVTRETLRLTGGKQRPYQNGSIVSELYYSLLPGAPRENSSGAVFDTSMRLGSASPPEALPYAPEMVVLPGGSFFMGSPELELDREPFREYRHEVKVRGFYMAARELTSGEFRRFVLESGYRTTAEQTGYAIVFNEAEEKWEARAGADWRNPGFRQNDDHPVVAVSWFDAVSYCNWLSEKEGLTPAYTILGEEVGWDKSAEGYRLPTEAEWEYACRGGTTTPFSTGPRISAAQANYDGNYPYNYGNKGLFRKATVPVGSFAPNPWGLYDMHGNVWEWCWDFYELFDGEEGDVAVNPGGPDSGAYRINRGGGWTSNADRLRSACRSCDFPETVEAGLGFRVARNQHASP
jgi:formylglycine-generating enzyme required for sulfatase activity